MNYLIRAWRMHQRAAGLCCVLLAGAAWLGNASATVEDQSGFFAFTEENDSLAGPFGQSHQDRHYTQGLKLTLMGADDCLTNITAKLDRLLPKWGIDTQAGDLGWILLGQNIYTPSNLLNRALIKGDRPFAGWLYTGAIYERRGELAANLAVMDSYEINLGVVGPDSLAGTAQRQWHRWFVQDDIPQGWGNQLHDEPGLVLKYARLWRYSPTTTTAHYVDFIPHVGGDLGNVFTFASVGATMRVGVNLPADFGVQTIDSPAAVNGGMTRNTPACFAYLFGTLDGRAVGHNITLDGNSFRGGPSIEKNVLVADVSWGMAFQVWRHLELTYVHIVRTEEFKGQNGNDIFGSFTLKAMFNF